MVYRILFILFLYTTCLLYACNNRQNASHEVSDEFSPIYTKNIDIELPQFLPCPEGWVETSFDAGQGYIIPYCKPPAFDSHSAAVTPQAPRPPNFLPCPSGWREVEDATTGVVTCNPYPEEGPMECEGVDEAHFPGDAGCVPIGTEYPKGDWAENLPTGRRIIYVKEGAVSGPGTDGSMLAPFGSINEAIEYAGTDAIIALSKGTFDEVVELPTGIVLWGTCVAATVVTSSIASKDDAVIISQYPNTELRNLQITGQRWGVVVSGPSAQLHIQDVLIKGVYTIGTHVSFGSLSANTLVVKDTQALQSDGTFGRGVHILAGASVHLSRSVFTNNRAFGIFAVGSGTELTLEDVLVDHTLSQQSNGIGGHGLQIHEGADNRPY